MKLLMQPIKVKNIEINNRLVMPPMAVLKSGNGKVTGCEPISASVIAILVLQEKQVLSLMR